MKTITLDQLRSHNACKHQVHLFRETFGESVTVSLELAEQYAQQFDFNGAARNLLPKSAYADYRKICDVAYADYLKIWETAYADYLKICDVAYADYCKINNPTHADYLKITDAISVNYRKIRNAAYTNYRKICATTFTRLYLSLEE